MRGLIKLTPVNANLNVEIKLEKCGDVYYRIAGTKKECLDVITDFIRTVFTSCQGKY